MSKTNLGMNNSGMMSAVGNMMQTAKRRDGAVGAMRSELAHYNAQWPEKLRQVPENAWPDTPPGFTRSVEVWRSRSFLVQVYSESEGVMRLSVSRTELPASPTEDLRFTDGIGWDELQALKAECGFGHLFAVECFPAEADVVDVANMRHLWVLPAPLPFAWTRGGRQ